MDGLSFCAQASARMRLGGVCRFDGRLLYWGWRERREGRAGVTQPTRDKLSLCR
jgi:hypothetical protein